MKNIIVGVLAAMLAMGMLSGCNNGKPSPEKALNGTDTTTTTDTLTAHASGLPAAKNAMYYWRTELRFSPEELAFMKRHHVGRLYLRMFDVVTDPTAPILEERTAPNASVRVGDEEYRLLADSLGNFTFVPVVYVTLDALKTMQGHEGMLADNIVSRVTNMCSYNGLPNVAELQLDCDWTASTEESFFSLCDSVALALKEKDLPWKLSSTIRLHQLRRKAPPVDRGVLMVYNTGNFSSPDAENSIIHLNDVKPYLKLIPDYELPLDVAYPSYSWQLVFHKRKFVGLANGIEVTDTTRFAAVGPRLYKALQDVPYNGKLILAGDEIREEYSTAKDVVEIKNLIESKLSGKPHTNIIYHLDNRNLSKYTPNEIESIFSTGR